MRVAHQATVPGYAAYNPAIQKNVPKYFAPIGASEILMAKPIRAMSRHAKRNGERILTWSDHDAKTMSRITIARLRSAMLNVRGLLTCAHIRRDRQ